MSGSYGPALPPGFSVSQGDDDEADKEHTGTTSLPGLQLPGTESVTEAPTPSAVYGPVLPPSSGPDTQATSTQGPSLPGSYETRTKRVEVEVEEEEDIHVIGPLPISQQEKEELERERRRAKVEYHAEKMKDKLSGKEGEEVEGPSREEWMTQLPQQAKAFGLGPRKFRTRDVDLGDRSVWTDTPADRLRKEQLHAEGKVKAKKKDTVTANFTSAKDEKLAAQVAEYNKSCRSESLMEMHRKRKAEENDETKTRRPFDREVDLQLPKNIIAPAKRQALMKDSATSLKSKFSHGTRHFL